MMRRVGTVLLSLVASSRAVNVVNTVEVDTSSILATTDRQYVGYNLGGEWLSEHYDTLSGLLKKFGSTHVRIGGTFGDYQIYDVGDDAGNYDCENLPSPMTDYLCKLVPASAFKNLFQFADDLNVKLIFGLNDMFGRPPKADGEPNICSATSCPKWDPSNTRALLQWMHENGFSVYALELGNELNKALRGQAGAKAQAEDLKTLKSMVDEIWSDTEDDLKPKVFGPDSHSWIMFANRDQSSDPDNWQAMMWFQELVKDACSSLDGITYHMYLAGPSNADVSNFTTPKFLDRSHTGASKIVDAVHKACPKLSSKIWAGETASANQGGIDGASDRFADVFWYVDQLGTLAKLGHAGFMRQKLVGGGTKYGLVQVSSDGQSVTPRPDFYAAMLFKELMSEKVLNVKVSGTDAEMLRAYAHCTTTSAKNHVTLALLNLSQEKRKTKFAGSGLSAHGYRHTWQLTNTVSGLSGFDVQLNGKPLTSDGIDFPDLTGLQENSPLSELILEPLSVSFVVLPAVSKSVCANASVVST